MVFRYKSDVNGLGIGLPFLEPEKMAFANTKTFQVWVSVFAFVVWKGCDPKWLQSLGIESDGTLEVTDCENNVVYHIFLKDAQVPDDQLTGMYGPPLRRKRNVRMSQVGLRKCIRPLLEWITPGQDGMRCALLPISYSVF